MAQGEEAIGGDTAPPAAAGWRPLAAPAGFLRENGPFYWRRGPNGLQIGFRVAARHCNPVGTCHGGMLATCADILAGFGIAFVAAEAGFLPTINLNCDFPAAARLGAWIAGEAEVVRVTGGMGFAAAVLRDEEGMPVLRASGVFKLPRTPIPGFSLHEYFPCK